MAFLSSMIGTIGDTLAQNQANGGYGGAQDLQQWSMLQQQQNLQPWTQAGQTALGQMQNYAANYQGPVASNDAGYQPVNVVGTPGSSSNPEYQFQLQQGTQALNASAAAKGGYFSGQTGVDLTNYGQGLAASNYQQQLQNYMGQAQFNAGQYQSAYNRQAQNQANQWNQWGQIANYGYGATNAENQNIGNYAANMGNLQVNQGNMNAGYTKDMFNQWGGSGSQFSSMLQ